MDNITISEITSAVPAYEQVWQLREEILRKPLGLSLRNEDLGSDHTELFFIAETGGRVIGTVMLHKRDAGQVQLRQMAVYNEWQGRGIGRMLVQAFEQYAQAHGYKKIILHARDIAKGFYLSLGYTAKGDAFEEVGITHYLMEKEL